jgi:hypothetical protein
MWEIFVFQGISAAENSKKFENIRFLEGKIS